MRIQVRSNSGSVLSTVLVIAGLVGILVAAQLTMVSRQNYFTMRSQIWASEIPIAEAGIEEAMAALNTPKPLTNMGWTLSGTNFVKRRTVGDGYCYISISTSIPPSITSVGFGRVPTQTNYTQRTIFVTTASSSSKYGIICTGPITFDLNGSPFIDSFNSRDPNWSTGGLYDKNKKHDKAAIATRSTVTYAVDAGNGTINGYVKTGPGGKVRGSIGSFDWIQKNPGLPDPSCVTDDFTMEFPAVDPPSTNGAMGPYTGVTIGGTTYNYVLGNGTYTVSSPLKLNSPMLVTNHATLILYSDLTVTGQGYIMLTNGGSLDLYLYGSATMAGGGIINGSGMSTNLVVRGMPSCPSISYGGRSAFIGIAYAPQTDLSFGGTSDAYGAFVGKSFTCSGSMQLHYDEALGIPAQGPTSIASWEEL